MSNGTRNNFNKNNRNNRHAGGQFLDDNSKFHGKDHKHSHSHSNSDSHSHSHSDSFNHSKKKNSFFDGSTVPQRGTPAWIEWKEKRREQRKEKRKKQRKLERLLSTSVFDRSDFSYLEKTKKHLEEWKNQAQELLKASCSVKKQEGVPSSAVVLDPWQKEALSYLNQGLNVVVDAPTTAGKTRIVEMFFREHLEDPKFKAIYTTPVKSLSNDKLYEFRKKFGEKNVGIATGDIKDNLQAPIVIATLECYRNSLLGIDEKLVKSIVIFDEYHYIQDSGRGSSWEQAIILSDENTQLLLLSASVGNPQSFVDWLSCIKQKEVKLVQTTYRPVPLIDLIYSKKDKTWVLASELNFVPQDFQNSRLPVCDYPKILQVFPAIIESELYPTIVYCGRRKQCSQFALDIVETILPWGEDRVNLIKQKFEDLDSSLGFSSFMDDDLKNMIINYGVCYHHSGLAFSVKLFIENLLKEGLIRFCVSTMGLSLGVDFSVKSALIVDMKRPDESGFVIYESGEVLQMLGRAGRRGRDPVGYSLWWDQDSYKFLKPSGRNNISTDFKTDPTTFLGLVGKGISLDEIETILTKSFGMYNKKDAKIDFITASRMSDYLGEELSCSSPVKEYQKYMSVKKNAKKRMRCYGCKFQKECFKLLDRASYNSGFVGLHFYLHEIGALTQDDKLTEFGSLARYFPQSGGMIVAKSITEGKVSIENFMSLVNLMGAFSLSEYKSPNAFGVKATDSLFANLLDEGKTKLFEKYYPISLFEELYDEEYGFYVYREFNSLGAAIIQDWIMGIDFKELEQKYTNDGFGVGDLMNLIYRTASYLQSLAQIHLGDLSEAAAVNRQILLRDPLDKTII